MLTAAQILVADEKSSTFEGKPKNAWDRDHTQMSKFEGGEKDENYKTLSLKLKEFAQRSFRTIKLRQDCECSTDALPLICSLRPVVKYFGRKCSMIPDRRKY